MGCPVPGWRTGGAGVLRSAWTLYHLVGMSFSSRRIFTRVLSDDVEAMAASLARDDPQYRELRKTVNQATIRHDIVTSSSSRRHARELPAASVHPVSRLRRPHPEPHRLRGRARGGRSARRH